MNILISSIRVDARMRKDLGDINDLAESLKTHNLMHPVVVLEEAEGYRLIAGERRLTAAKRAGWTEVPATVFRDLNDLQVKSMELEENIKRENLSIAEQARGVKELEELKQALHGKPKPGVNKGERGYTSGFGRADTAKLLKRSVGAVTQDIQIAEALEFFPDLETLNNKSQILREYKRRKEAIVLTALAKMDAESSGTSDLDSSFLNVDCLEWMKAQPPGMCDLVIADPPWGIGIEDSYRSHEGGRQGKHYDDAEEKAKELMLKMVPLLYRVLRDDRHMYFFFGIQHYQWVMELLLSSGFNVDPVPLVWNKTHFTRPPSGNRWPGQWEAIFFCRKGDRKLELKSGGNVIDCPIVLPSERIHISEKPTALYHPMIHASTVENELIFDPCAGSGSVYLAASQCKRRSIGLELDKDIYLKAKDHLRESLKTPCVPDLANLTLPTCIYCGKTGTDIHVTTIDKEGPCHSECLKQVQRLEELEKSGEGWWVE